MSSATGSTILTLQEVIRERMLQCADAALSRFRAAIRPVYGSDGQGHPEQIGTCILVRIRGEPCLLTAAHVIDENAYTSLYVGGDELVLMESEFLVSSKPDDERRTDTYDFALGVLSPGKVAALGSVQFIDEEEIAGSAGSTSGHAFLCVGYPNSKNRIVGRASRSIRPSLLRYTSTAVDRPELASELNASGEHHVFIDFRKHSRDETGLKVPSYGLRGCSGGAVIDLGKIATIEAAAGLVTPRATLIGLLIEHRKEHHVILATRLDAIVQAYLSHRQPYLR